MKVILQNIAFNVSSKIVTTALSILFVPIYISYLGVENYGIFGIYTSIVSAIFIFDLGFSSIVSKELAQKKHLSDHNSSMGHFIFTVECLYLLIGLLIVAFLWLFSDWMVFRWIHSNVNNPNLLIKYFHWIAIAIFVQWPHSLYSSALYGLGKQNEFNGYYTLFSISKVIGAYLVLKYFGANILYFLWWNILVSVLLSFWLRIYLHIQLPKGQRSYKFSWGEVQSIQKLIYGLSFIGILSFVINDLDKMFMLRFLTIQEFGYYTIAFTIPAGILLLVTSIKNSLLPSISTDTISKNLQDFQSKFYSYFQLITTLIVPMTVFIAVFSYQVLFLWTSKELLSLEIANLTSWLVIGSLIYGVNLLFFNYCMVLERSNFFDSYQYCLGIGVHSVVCL